MKPAVLVPRTLMVVIVGLVLTAVAPAQVTVGDNTTLSLQGSLGFGYTGQNGNADYVSAHGLGLAGDLQAQGYYFHPNFFNFQAQSYFDRSQVNADVQSITRDTGFNVSTGIFGGSRFPGSIGYGWNYSQNEQYQVGGVPSVLGDGKGSSFSVGWAALVDNFPKIYVNYLHNSASANVLGTDERSSNATDTFNVNADYTLHGFPLHGFFNRYHSEFDTPAFLTGEPIFASGSGTSFGLWTQHKIPLSGSIGLGWSHSLYGNDDGQDASSNNFNASASFTPVRRLYVSSSANYTTNLQQVLAQTLLSDTAVLLRTDRQTTSFNDANYVNITVGHGFGLNGYANYNLQHAGDRDYSVAQYGGAVSYHRNDKILGLFRVSFGMLNTITQAGEPALGFVSSVTADRRFGRWQIEGDFNYNQSIETTYALVQTSNYSYGGSVRRKFQNKRTFMSFAYRGSHSGMSYFDGINNYANTYVASAGWKRYRSSVSYAVSNGSAVLTSNGTLVSTPLGSLVTDQFSLYNAKSLSVNGSTFIIQRLTVAGGYSRVSSDSQSNNIGYFTNGSNYYGSMTYSLRKFQFQAGYSRAQQFVSSETGPARVLNSYYLSLSRWFNVF